MYGTYSDKPDGNWERTAEMMMVQLHTESSHPIFRAFCAFEREREMGITVRAENISELIPAARKIEFESCK